MNYNRAVKIATAERVSERDVSDNYVFRRSLLAYRRAAELVSGDILEIGTGAGYGIPLLAPRVKSLLTVDKYMPPLDLVPYDNVEFRQMAASSLGSLASESFDCVVTFQVIEHIRNDAAFVREIERLLKPGGLLILSTPNRLMSLTRNPWHVREYTAGELKSLLGSFFAWVEMEGVFGNDRVMEYYEKNRRAVERITRFDPLGLQYRLPRWMLRIPYDILNRRNRRRLLIENHSLTAGIEENDYFFGPAGERCFDLFYTARKST